MLKEHDFAFPIGSLPFLENIRKELSSESMLVFSDFLEENAKQRLAELFRRIAGYAKLRDMRRALLKSKPNNLPTLVEEGTKLAGFIGRGFGPWGGSMFTIRYGVPVQFIATRTKRVGFLRWECDHSLPLQSRVIIPKDQQHLLVNIKPCSFADRLIKNSTLKYRWAY